jgi:membrane-bound serine protease (ClpP class)
MVDRMAGARQVRTKDGELRVITDREYDDLRLESDGLQLVHTIAEPGNLVSLSGSEAVRFGLADAVADSLGDVLALVGSTGANVVTLERSRSEELLSLLERLAPLLVMAGLILGYMELKSPGFGLPGILSIACFLTLLIGRYMAGLADVPHIVLVVLGLALVATELFLFPGTLWIGLAGGTLVLLGLLAAELGPGFELSSPLDRELALDAAFQLMLTAAAAMVGMWVLARFLPEMPVLNRLVQLPAGPASGFAEAMQEASDRHAGLARAGARGVALTALRPVGKVALDADPSIEFEARADGELIDAGARVRVVEVASARLVVEREPLETAPPAEAGA